MNIFPLISSPVSDLGTELPLAREVRWDFTKDEPVWHGGNPATVTGSEAVLVWAWNTLNTSRYQAQVEALTASVEGKTAELAEKDEQLAKKDEALAAANGLLAELEATYDEN